MEFKFEFTEKEINLILTGLAELPAKMSMEMIMKLKNHCIRRILMQF